MSDSDEDDADFWGENWEETSTRTWQDDVNKYEIVIVWFC